MSYILDALKKLENDKEKKNRTTGVVNISGELLRHTAPVRKPQRAVWPRIVMVVLVVGLLGGGAVWWLQRGGVPKKKIARMGAATSQVTPASPPVVAPPLPVQAPASVAPVQMPQPQSAAPVPTPALPVATTPAPAKTVGAGTAAAADDDDDSRDRRRRARHGASAERKQTEATAQASLVAAPAEIKVSGIAWQEERAARRAVVNGYLMREGGVVAGATIIEIRTDKVRFKGASGRFEIPLLAAGALPGNGK